MLTVNSYKSTQQPFRGTDKLRLMSESARGEGGRIWVPKQKGDNRNPLDIPENERWYFLEEKYPKYGNLVPRDIATREIFEICRNLGMGIGGGDQVYLDLSFKDPEELDKKLGGIMEIYEKFVGDDPRQMPMKIFPGVHYSMGGLWAGYEKDSEGIPDIKSHKNQMTNIAGLYASGEVDYQYHGANRLGANSLLSCVYGGMIGADAMNVYSEGLDESADEVHLTLFENERRKWEDKFASLAEMHGSVNPYKLHEELGDLMTGAVTVVRRNDELESALSKLNEFSEKWKECNVLDASATASQAINFTNQLELMIDIAKVITKGALLRNESRGAHYKPEFPERDDENFMKTTIAEYNEEEPKISYEDIDYSMIEPILRKY